MNRALPMKCPSCDFATMTRDIDLYVHLVDVHNVPHATAHVLFIQAVREAYPMNRWIERLTPTNIPPPSTPPKKTQPHQTLDLPLQSPTERNR